MPARLEIALKDHLTDAEGEGIRQKALAYFGIELSQVRTVHVITIDAELSAEQLGTIQREIFTNPVIQFSSFEPLDISSGLDCVPVSEIIPAAPPWRLWKISSI